jgi:hypothetical protein
MTWKCKLAELFIVGAGLVCGVVMTAAPADADVVICTNRVGYVDFRMQTPFRPVDGDSGSEQGDTGLDAALGYKIVGRFVVEGEPGAEVPIIYLLDSFHNDVLLTLRRRL